MCACACACMLPSEPLIIFLLIGSSNILSAVDSQLHGDRQHDGDCLCVTGVREPCLVFELKTRPLTTFQSRQLRMHLFPGDLDHTS